MLIIRKEQLQHLAIYEKISFKMRLKTHLKEFFPLQISLANDGALDQFIESGIEEAQSLGFDTEATVQSYTDHLILLGSHFCQNPLYTEISAPLFDSEIEDLIQRHDILYDRAWEYLDRTRGPDAGNLLRASAKLLKVLPRRSETTSTNPSDLVETLKAIYPEKYAAHTRDTLVSFCIESLRRAQLDKFEQPAAQALYVILAFLAGIGFYHDPLIMNTVSGQTAVLSEQADASEQSRFLTESAELYLDRLFEAIRLST